MKRLTVHVSGQPKVDTKEPAKINKKATSKSSYETAIDQGKADKASAGKEKSQGQKGRYKVYNTITVRDLKDMKDVNEALAEVRKNYTIAICEDSRRSNWKSGDEMYHVANQK
tara:strand:- start:174 stop:512 length:339 start_codon:yes stop_codon:yes gene_type:complete